MRAREAALLLILAVVPGAAWGSGKAKVWSDIDTQDLGAAYLFDVGQPGSWSIGPMFSWQDNRDLDSDDQWSAGFQVEMQTDPNATIPVSDWIGVIGASLGLPETVQARAYIVAENKLVSPFESESDNLDAVSAVGPGIGIGPVYLEYVYQVVDGGGIPALNLESGPVLRFGAAIKTGKPKASR